MIKDLFSRFKTPLTQFFFIIVVVILGIFFFQLALSLLGIILLLGVVAISGALLYFLVISIKLKLTNPQQPFRSPWTMMVESIQTWFKDFDGRSFQPKPKTSKKTREALNVCSHCGHVESNGSSYCSKCHQKL